MNETFEQAQLTQILYEISMSIGTSVELRAILKPSLSTILKKLNCVSGAVYQKEQQGQGAYQFEAAYTIPRHPQRNKTYQEALALLPKSFTETEANTFLATLPIVGQSADGDFYHILDLPAFGLLILIKNQEALAEPIIKSLTPLLTKLAAAAMGSLNTARLLQSEQTIQEGLEKQRELHDISLELSVISELDELYQQIVIQARDRLGFDRVSLYLLDLDNQTMTSAYGVSAEGVIRSKDEDTLSFEDRPGIRDLVHNKKRLLVDEDSDLFEQQQVVGHGWQITALLWGKEAPVGVLFADNLLNQEPLKPYQPELLAAYAANVANTIEWKRADLQMRQAQERTETILQSVTVPMLISRISDGMISYANKHLADIVRTTVDEMIGNQTPNFYVRGEDRVAIISKIQTEGSCQNYELELQRIDGEHFWALLTARLIQFEGESAIITSLIDITERREAQNALARQAADLQAVAALSTQVAAIQDPQTLMEMVVQETQRQFDLYHCHIFLLDEAGRQLRIQACGWHPAAQEYGTHGASVIPINNEKSLVARAARTRQAVVVNDVHNDPHWLPNELLPDTRSEMAVPMITGGRVLGVLDVQSAELNHFTEDDVQIQSTLAAQMAVALENARSLAKSQQAIEEMNLLTRRLTREGWSEYATLRADRDAGYRYDLGQLSPIKIEEESEAVALAAETAVPSTNGHLSHSLMVHGETIGHLTVFNETEAEQLDDDAALIMAAVAEQLSVRVENIRLSDQTQQALAQTQDQAQRLSLLNEISAEMSNAETLNEVFNIIFDRIPDLMKADRVSLAMLRPDGENIEIIDYRGEMNIPVGTTIRLADTLMNEALQQNRIIVNHEARPDSDINSSMIAPILSAGRGIGVLNIGSKRVNSMTEQDETLLQQLATMLSSIIENKQLLAAAQTRADRERLVRTITDKIRRGTDREAILTIARQEISEMLGANQSVAQLGAKTQLLERLQQVDKSGMIPESGTSS